MTLNSIRTKPPLLICDDEISVTKALEKLLADYFEIQITHNGKQALRALEQRRYDLLLIDYGLPDQKGTEILQAAHLLAPESVRILLSGMIDLKVLTETINQGLVHRVFLKPWDNNSLILELQGAVAFQKILSERHLFEKMSLIDPITGLLNRRAIEQRLYEEVARSQRHLRPLTLFMLDIDHFKRTNDEMGHPAADKMLKALAEILRQSLRNIDIIGRYGGDEFLIILPDTKLDQAKDVADRMRQQIQGKLHKTVSIGIAAFPEHADQSLSLIESADQALLMAKKHGRNQTMIAAAIKNS